MSSGTRYEAASERFDRKLSELVAEQLRSEASAKFIPTSPPLDAGDKATHPDWFVHAGIEVTHHVLANIAPFELVAARMCGAANDHAKNGIAQALPDGAGAFATLKYLPGPLQQMALELVASVATVGIPPLMTRRRDRGLGNGSRQEGSGKITTPPLAALRSKAPTIGKDVVLAGLSELAVEVIGLLTREVRAICDRLLRAIRHAMFPALKGIRVLLFREDGLGQREAIDLALKLFVQAGIVGTCIVAEHELHRLLQPFFGTYSNAVSVICMAVLCWLACHLATATLDRIDVVGVRRERDLQALLNRTRERRLQNDRRVQELLGKVRVASRS